MTDEQLDELMRRVETGDREAQMQIIIDGSDPIEMSTGNYKRWHWVPVGPLFKLSAGVHTLKIANSEDGAKLDAVFLTSNIGRVPVGRIEQLTPQALVR